MGGELHFVTESMSSDDSVLDGGNFVTGRLVPLFPSLDIMLSAPSLERSVSPSSSLHLSLSAASMDLRCMPVSGKEDDGENRCRDFVLTGGRFATLIYSSSEYTRHASENSFVEGRD